MNIGLDIRSLLSTPRTGVGEYTYQLLDAILKIDEENQYFLYYNSFANVEYKIPKWNKSNIHYCPTRIPNKILNATVSLFNQPKMNHLVNTNNNKIDLWFAPNLNFTAITSQTKYILTIHDLSFELFPEYFTRKQILWHKSLHPKKQCERADLIITPSENTKRDIINYYQIAPKKIQVIYPGIQQFEVHSSELTTGGQKASVQYDIVSKYGLPEKYFLFLGTIEPRKNLIGVIKAFEKYSGVCHLVIAGAPGWKNSAIHKFVTNSSKKEKIKIIGFVPEEEKPALYAGAVAFVYPSFYEGFGFPVLEAMQAGTPVITANRSSLPEITGPAAYLVNPIKPDQITLAMTELAADKNLRNWHVSRGLLQVQKFTWEKAADEWLRAIKLINH